MSDPERYAVAGNPVEHSQSPFIHTLFAQATGQPVAYGRLLCPLDGFAAAVRDFAASGARGCNITVPFKFEAHDLAQHRSARATLAQAANVLRFDENGWYADNSDGVGLVRDIERNAGVTLRQRRVLMVGAGGAAAGALGPLIEAGPQQIVIANRSVNKAETLVQRHAALAAQQGVQLKACGLAAADLTAPSLSAPSSAFDVVINATATSLQGAAVPVDARVLRPGALALDMMYGPAAASFLQWAGHHGAEARDGLGMLVEQAAEAFHIWRGVVPETAPVLAALRTRLSAP